jgi:transcriptional regulator with XRE-family HTH domain
MKKNLTAGDALRQYRKRRKLTQQELCRYLGVNRQAVSQWEQGVRKVDIALLSMVHRLTGIPPAVLRPDIAALFGKR